MTTVLSPTQTSYDGDRCSVQVIKATGTLRAIVYNWIDGHDDWKAGTTTLKIVKGDFRYHTGVELVPMHEVIGDPLAEAFALLKKEEG